MNSLGDMIDDPDDTPHPPAERAAASRSTSFSVAVNIALSSVQIAVGARRRVLARHRVLSLMTHVDSWRRADLAHDSAAVPIERAGATS